jgi:hypothetical protein
VVVWIFFNFYTRKVIRISALRLKEDFDIIAELKGRKVFLEVLNGILIGAVGGRVLIATLIINWIINKKGDLICFQ